MKLIVKNTCTDPDKLPFDTAERKGIGHPDSLADLVADTFSIRYAAWSLEQHGVIPNHWVDKVNLVGAAAEVRFGGFDILKPIDCYLFGKVTERVGGMEIPIDTIFSDAVAEVLRLALDDKQVLEHIRFHHNNTSGVAVDHDARFYRPGTTAGVTEVLAVESVANDTVICVGGSRVGVAGTVAADVERLITGERFRQAWPAIGTDVKVMVVRAGDELDITAAVPFHPESVASWRDYVRALGDVQEALAIEVKQLLAHQISATPIAKWALHLNTKDTPGRGYLAPFGTSLGKGDCGAVGRGNRHTGVIEPLRPASCEAPAGKNPLHHAGKIYTALTADMARLIELGTGTYAEVTIAARNGGGLDDPAYVFVGLDREPDSAIAAVVEDAVQSTLAQASSFADRFLQTDLIGRFRAGVLR